MYPIYVHLLKNIYKYIYIHTVHISGFQQTTFFWDLIMNNFCVIASGYVYFGDEYWCSFSVGARNLVKGGVFCRRENRQLKSWLSLRAPPLAPMSSHFVTDSEDLWERWSQPLWLQTFFLEDDTKCPWNFWGLIYSLQIDAWKDDFVLFGFRPIFQGEMLVVLGRYQYHLWSRRFRVYLKKTRQELAVLPDATGEMFESQVLLWENPSCFPWCFPPQTMRPRSFEGSDNPNGNLEVPSPFRPWRRFKVPTDRETFPSCNSWPFFNGAVQFWWCRCGNCS